MFQAVSIVFTIQSRAQDEVLVFKEVSKDKTSRSITSSVHIQSKLKIDINNKTLLEYATKNVPGTAAAEEGENGKISDYLDELKEVVEMSGSLSASFISFDVTNRTTEEFHSLPQYEKFSKDADKFYDLLNVVSKDLPEFRQKLNSILLAEPKLKQGQEFLKMAEVVKELLGVIEEDLDQRINQSLVSFRIEAYHTTVAGSRAIVGPLPYVSIKECISQPYNPFNIIPDERAMKEYQFASKLAPIAEDAISGKFEDELKMQIEKITTIAQDIKKSIRPDLLDPIINQMKEAQDAVQNNPKLSELKNTFDELKSFDNNLDKLSQLSAPDHASFLNSIMGEINKISNDTEQIYNEVKSTPSKVEEILTDALKSGPNTQDLKKSITEYLANIKAEFFDNDKYLTDYFKGIKEIAETYQKMTSIKDAADNLSAKIENFPINAAVGGVISLEDFCQNRSSGDRLKISAILVDAVDQEKVLWKEGHHFTIRDYSWHINTTGFLAFVNPGSDKNVTTKQDYIPSPGIAWYLKKDWRKQDIIDKNFNDRIFVNDVWSPGVGMAMMALDFNDDDSFEVGLALSVTMFKNLIHVSYGINLQTESDFFSVGINPLVVKQLFNSGNLGK